MNCTTLQVAKRSLVAKEVMLMMWNRLVWRKLRGFMVVLQFDYVVAELRYYEQEIIHMGMIQNGVSWRR